MSSLVLTAALMGPGALAATTLAAVVWRHRNDDDLDVALAVATEYVNAHAAGPEATPPPPDGGVPTPAGGPLADVIPFPARRAA